jgi:hypothetical protein
MNAGTLERRAMKNVSCCRMGWAFERTLTNTGNFGARTGHADDVYLVWLAEIDITSDYGL